MKILSQEERIPEDQWTRPIALTIGVYDGVHLGHQAIIKELHKKTGPKGIRSLITFSSHPEEILGSNLSLKPLILSFSHRLHLLEKYGIDYILPLPFALDLASTPYDDFLFSVRKKIPFSHLILGEGAAFGKNREGTESHIRALAKEWGFQVEYVKKKMFQKKAISSERIREAIRTGELKTIKKLMGRPYTVRVPYSPLDVKKENETLSKWSFTCSGLVPLPSGVYAVDLETKEGKIAAVAFLLSKAPLSSFTLTLFFETPPSHSFDLTLIFIDHLHRAIDLNTFDAAPFFSRSNLSPQPTSS